MRDPLIAVAALLLGGLALTLRTPSRRRYDASDPDLLDRCHPCDAALRREDDTDAR